MGHARSLITIEDEGIQKKILDKVVDEGISVRQIEEEVRKISSPQKNKSGKNKNRDDSTDDPFYKDISARLRRTFSTKVSVKPKKEGGEIKIEYYSDDDLERILSIFDSID